MPRVAVGCLESNVAGADCTVPGEEAYKLAVVYTHTHTLACSPRGERSAPEGIEVAFPGNQSISSPDECGDGLSLAWRGHLSWGQIRDAACWRDASFSFSYTVEVGCVCRRGSFFLAPLLNVHTRTYTRERAYTRPPK